MDQLILKFRVLNDIRVVGVQLRVALYERKMVSSNFPHAFIDFQAQLVGNIEFKAILKTTNFSTKILNYYC